MVQEIWRKVSGYEDYYMVSNLGNIKSLSKTINTCHKSKRKTRERILKPCRTGHGYLQVTLCKKNKLTQKSIHLIVAKEFIINKYNKKEINHINGIKTDNRVDNLEWVTSSENKIHALKYNIKKKKLRPSDIEVIRKRISNGENYTDIGKDYGVKKSIISKIKLGKSWGYV